MLEAQVEKGRVTAESPCLLRLKQERLRSWLRRGDCHFAGERLKDPRVRGPLPGSGGSAVSASWVCRAAQA